MNTNLYTNRMGNPVSKKGGGLFENFWRKIGMVLVGLFLMGNLNVSAQFTIEKQQQANDLSSITPCGTNWTMSFTQPAYNTASLTIKYNSTAVDASWNYTGCSYPNWGAGDVVAGFGTFTSNKTIYVTFDGLEKKITFSTSEPICSSDPEITSLSPNNITFSKCQEASSSDIKTFSIKGNSINDTGDDAGITVSTLIPGLVLSQGSNSGESILISKDDAENTNGAIVSVYYAGSDPVTNGSITCTANGGSGTNASKTIDVTIDILEASVSVDASSITTSGFDYSLGSANPPVQSFTISGQCLSGDINITPSEDFEISLTNNSSGFSNDPITISPDGGTIYVRLAPGLPEKETPPYTGTITVEHATTSFSQIIVVTGKVTIPVRNFYLKQNGNWSSNTTWSFACGGDAVAVSDMPITEHDSVIIGCNNWWQTVTVDVTEAKCRGISIASGGTVALNGKTLSVGNFGIGTNNANDWMVDFGNSANSILKISRDMTWSQNLNGSRGFINASSGVLELNGCNQTINIVTNFTIGTFRQSATCSAKYTKGGRGVINFTTYDQNCNPICLAGNTNDPQTGWMPGFNGNADNTTRWDLCTTDPNCAGRINAECGPFLNDIACPANILTAIKGIASSTPASFTVSGKNIEDGYFTVSFADSNTDFVFCDADGSNPQSTLTLSPSDVNGKYTVYVRLSTSAGAGDKSAIITVTPNDVTGIPETKTCEISGNVLPFTVSLSTDQTYCIGTELSLSANVTGVDNDYTYTFYQGETQIGEANSGTPTYSYLIPAGTTGDLAFKVTVSNGSEEITSEIQTVNPASSGCPAVTFTTAGIQFCSDIAQGVDVDAVPVVSDCSGCDITYEWFKDGVSQGAVVNTYSALTDITETGSYVLNVYMNGMLLGTSNPIVLSYVTTPEKPVITATLPSTNCPGKQAIFTIGNLASMSSDYTYEWYDGISSSPVSTSNSYTLTFPDQETDTGYSITVKVINSCGESVTSDAKAITAKGNLEAACACQATTIFTINFGTTPSPGDIDNSSCSGSNCPEDISDIFTINGNYTTSTGWQPPVGSYKLIDYNTNGFGANAKPDASVDGRYLCYSLHNATNNATDQYKIFTIKDNLNLLDATDSYSLEMKVSNISYYGDAKKQIRVHLDGKSWDLYIVGENSTNAAWTSIKVIVPGSVLKDNGLSLFASLYGGERSDNILAVDDITLAKICPPAVTDNNFYVKTVDNGGNDNADGISWATAFATVDKALEAVQLYHTFYPSGSQAFIHVAAGTYTAPAAGFPVFSNVTIYGGYPENASAGNDKRNPATPARTGGNETKFIQNSNSSRIISVSAGVSSLEIKGIRFGQNNTGANLSVNGAALYMTGGSITLDSCWIEGFKDNTQNIDRYSAMVIENGNLTIKNTTISDNEGQRAAGLAVIKGAAVIKIYNSTFANNTSRWGGGAILFRESNTNATVDIYNSTFFNNTGESSHPVIRFENEGNVRVSCYNVTMEGNTSMGDANKLKFYNSIVQNAQYNSVSGNNNYNSNLDQTNFRALFVGNNLSNGGGFTQVLKPDVSNSTVRSSIVEQNIDLLSSAYSELNEDQCSNKRTAYATTLGAYEEPHEISAISSAEKICQGETATIETTSSGFLYPDYPVEATTYKWYKDGALLPEETSGSITINDAGRYVVHAFVQGREPAIVADTIDVESGSSVKPVLEITGATTERSFCYVIPAQTLTVSNVSGEQVLTDIVWAINGNEFPVSPTPTAAFQEYINWDGNEQVIYSVTANVCGEKTEPVSITFELGSDCDPIVKIEEGSIPVCDGAATIRFEWHNEVSEQIRDAQNITYEWTKNGSLDAPSTDPITEDGDYLITIKSGTKTLVPDIPLYVRTNLLWTGMGASEDWNDTDNWKFSVAVPGFVGGIIPTACHNIVIPEPDGVDYLPVLTAPAFCNNIYFKHAAAIGGRIQDLNYSTVSADMTIQSTGLRDEPRWYMLSPALAGTSSYNYTKTGYISYMRYFFVEDGATSWTAAHPANEQLSAGQGVVYRAISLTNQPSLTISFLNSQFIIKENYVEEEQLYRLKIDLSDPLDGNGGSSSGAAYENEEYVIVGNPFMSYLNVGKFLERNSNLEEIAATDIKIYDGASKGFLSSAIHEQTRWIAPFQAFFVKPHENKGGITDELNLEFTPDMLDAKAEEIYRLRGFNMPEDILRIRAIQNGYTSLDIVVKAKEGASNDFNPDEDATKLFSNESPLEVSTLAGNKACDVNVLNRDLLNELLVPVNIKSSKAGEITLEINGATGFMSADNIYLYDNLTKTTTSLLEQNIFVISKEEAGNINGRFFLQFIKEEDEEEYEPISTIVDDPASGKLFISTQQDHLVVNARNEQILQVTIYDMTGRKIHEANKVNNNTYRTILPGDAAYLVKVMTDKQVKTGKVIVR